MPERNELGQFKPGTSGNQGNVGQSYNARMRRAMQDAVSEDDWIEIVQHAAETAKAGSTAARKWLSEYLLGKPVEIDDVMIYPVSLEEWERSVALRKRMADENTIVSEGGS